MATKTSKQTTSRKQTTARAASKSRTRARAKPGSTPASDWRKTTLARLRGLILEADPEMIEEQKWKKPSNPGGVPLWSHDGMVCTGEIYKNYVKLTFAYGAGLPDPARLFNASLGAGTRRAIDIREGEKIDAEAFKKLVRAAVRLNARRIRG